MADSNEAERGGNCHYEVENWSNHLRSFESVIASRRGDSIRVLTAQQRAVHFLAAARLWHPIAGFLCRAGKGPYPNRQLERIFKTWGRTSQGRGSRKAGDLWSLRLWRVKQGSWTDLGKLE